MAIRDDDGRVWNVWSITFGGCVDSGCQKVKGGDNIRTLARERKDVDCVQERCLIRMTETKFKVASKSDRFVKEKYV